MKLTRLQSQHAQVWLLRATAVVLLFGTWGYLAQPGHVSPILLASPAAVVRALGQTVSSTDFWQALQATALEIAVAFSGAVVIGLAVGFWAARRDARANAVESLLTWGYIAPLILFYPIFILWFGVGMWSKILYAGLSSFFPIAFNSLKGFRGVSGSYLDVGKAFGATPRQLDLRIKFPAALPLLSAGARVGAAVCMITVVLAEMLASEKGLGYLISQDSAGLDIPAMFAVMVFVLLIVALVQLLLNRALNGQSKKRGMRG